MNINFNVNFSFLNPCKSSICYFALTFAFWGCGSKKSVSYPIKASVLSLQENSLSPDQVPKFSLGTRTFNHMTDLGSLDSDNIQLLQGGNLSITESAGSLLSSDKFDGAHAPKLQYDVINDVVVAKDTPTLMMLSAFYQYDRIIDLLQAATGIKATDFRSSFGKMQVLFEPSIQFTGEVGSTNVTQKTNAAFVPTQKQFVLLQSSRIENIPLAGNLQVIGHEFGHALFENTFYQNNFESCVAQSKSGRTNSRVFAGRLENEFVMRGLNEGFADFLSFVLTGSANILGSSFDGDVANLRNFATSNMTFDKISGSKSNNPEFQSCDRNFYCIGTLFAKSLLQAMIAQSLNTQLASDRHLFMSKVIFSVRQMKLIMATLPDTILPNATNEQRECNFNVNDGSTYRGSLLGAAANAFVAGLPQDMKPTICKSFIDNLGNVGFSSAARVVCP